MGTGAITGYIDVAQVALYAFWIFFFLLVRHLHREGKREGWPLELDGSGDTLVEGVISQPIEQLNNSSRTACAEDVVQRLQPLTGFNRFLFRKAVPHRIGRINSVSH